jgi:uncharacterized protein DUF6600
MTFRWRFLLPAAAWLLIGACATGRGPVPEHSMPAARAALRPEYRIFYDALADYGDWVLVEPFGFVFRPDIDYQWRPYEQGFWAPTDAYGWVWISSEPFGWATYHYGQWRYDSYKGWVWQPGLDWGPAWVSWQIANDWVGWSPLLDDAGGPQGGSYVWAPIEQLGSTDVRLSLKQARDLGEVTTAARRVDNTVVRDGVRIQLGPSMQRVERALGGPLTRVRVEDLVPEAATAPVGAPGSGIDQTRRAAEEAARQAKALSERGGRVPLRLPVVRPLGVPGPAGTTPGPGRKIKQTAGRDSVGSKRH